MQIIFKNNGEIDGYTSWLRSFKEIGNSLLIEVDLVNQCFKSKSYLVDRSVVKYGELSFDDAGFAVESVQDGDVQYTNLQDWLAKSEGRIKVPIFLILPKFIDQMNVFATTDTIEMVLDCQALENGDWQTKKLECLSKSLRMQTDVAGLTEFVDITDDKFAKMSDIPAGMTFEVVPSALKTLEKISSIYAVDAKKDVIKFYTKQEQNRWALYAYDNTGKHYDYLLGFIVNADENGAVENEVAVFRNNFFMCSKGTDDNILVTISGSTDKALNNRVKVATGNFTSIIAAVNI